jgi:gamma-glutamyltranspeptidase/glutathione hydrolase
MTIVEPCSNGLGSDAFCILWDGERLHGLNASGRAPQAWTPEYFRGSYGADAKTAAQCAAGTRSPCPVRCRPGSSLSRRFGKLPFGDLMAAGDRGRRARLCGAGDRAAEVVATPRRCPN